MNKDLTPEELLGDLFYDAHRQRLFEDDKTFADARFKIHPKVIVSSYEKQKNNPDFDLRAFIDEYFELHITTDSEYSSNEKSLVDHIEKLWARLKRMPSKKKERSSIIELPYPYIVPGGRFNEIYYWDSYFTMLGLDASGEHDLIEHMVDNFKYLIDTYGHIPNGNRTYFLSRSQPPFFSLMVKLLIKIKGVSIIPKYLPSLVTEYNFWMNGISDFKENEEVTLRVARVDKSFLLNRYYDSKDTPREEMYGEDWALIDFSEEKNNPLFRHLRAACESGWDFSSRWLKDSNDLKSIETLKILPVDLNCLMWHLEKLISECYKEVDKQELSLNYGILAINRKKAIRSIFWDYKEEFFFDYHLEQEGSSGRYSLAGMFPLFFELATQEQADKAAEAIKKYFLKDGGLVTTPLVTGQQWDAPNGWAPLQYIAVMGLLKYGHKLLAQEISTRWINLNGDVFGRTNKMLEKYNVVDTQVEGGGGEYPVQDGFGWTNGVYLGLLKA